MNDNQFKSSTVGDCLRFDDLKNQLIQLISENYDNVVQPNKPSNLYDEDSTVQYYLNIINDITKIKNRFIEKSSVVDKNIDEKMEELLHKIKRRKDILKKELNIIKTEKILKWEKQISFCENFVLQQTNSSHQTITDIETFDERDLFFDSREFSNIIRTINSLGSIVSNQSRYLKVYIPNKVHRKFTFGSSGKAPSEFCRPWGVTCDTDGRILVCDRTNHRVQVFTEEGEFAFSFGREGTANGEFNRPTGIVVNSSREIIVSDKDNHRIQVFTFFGRFLFRFGSQGKNPGQFQYPWDVDVNSKGEIAVSDSKNHRIQLFSRTGSFLKIFGRVGSKTVDTRAALKVLDSPRGLCFFPDDTLAVTDFNNHKLLFIRKNFKKFYTFGCEGHTPGKFFRPQGIGCDASGKFAVADSKNYRIQIFRNNGEVVQIFGTKGDGELQFDCPQGISFHKSGNLLVVDLNNNRVQVF